MYMVTLHLREMLEEIARVEAQVFSEPLKVGRLIMVINHCCVYY